MKLKGREYVREESECEEKRLMKVIVREAERGVWDDEKKESGRERMIEKKMGRGRRHGDWRKEREAVELEKRT